MSIRLRLTALYTLLFGACGAVLLGDRLLARAPPRRADAAAGLRRRRARPRSTRSSRSRSAGRCWWPSSLGYLVADRALAPLRRVTTLAQRVTQERMDERIALQGPHDELRELADTVDGMLDRLAGAFDGQRRFVANASHELRTPLTVIRAEVEVALADPDADVRRPPPHGRGRARGRRPYAGAARFADGARAQPAGAAALRAGRPRRRRPHRRRDDRRRGRRPRRGGRDRPAQRAAHRRPGADRAPGRQPGRERGPPQRHGRQGPRHDPAGLRPGREHRSG